MEENDGLTSQAVEDYLNNISYSVLEVIYETIK